MRSIRANGLHDAVQHSGFREVVDVLVRVMFLPFSFAGHARPTTVEAPDGPAARAENLDSGLMPGVVAPRPCRRIRTALEVDAEIGIAQHDPLSVKRCLWRPGIWLPSSCLRDDAPKRYPVVEQEAHQVEQVSPLLQQRPSRGRTNGLNATDGSASENIPQ